LELFEKAFLKFRRKNAIPGVGAETGMPKVATEAGKSEKRKRSGSDASDIEDHEVVLIFK
jgi:hypothetical protein